MITTPVNGDEPTGERPDEHAYDPITHTYDT